MGSTFVTVSEGRSVFIDNHRGIINFDDAMIVIRITTGKLIVSGASLTVRAIADRKIVIGGKIQSVEWE